MSGNYTARSNFKTPSRDANISEIFSTKFTGPVLASPANFQGTDNPASLFYVPTPEYLSRTGTIPIDRDFVCDIPINGSDTATGFAKPTGAPLYATVKYGMYVIDQMVGFPSNDAAGVASIAPVVLESVVIDGVATTALSMTQLAVPDATFNAAFHSGGFRQQLWFTIQRDLSSAADITVAGVEFDFWISTLPDKMDSTRNRCTIFDIKKNSAARGGSLRHLVTLVRANSTDAAEFNGVSEGDIGWELILDNDANSHDPALTKEEFIRVKNYTVPVPQETWTKMQVYWKDGASYSDTTTGRYVVRIKQGGVWVTIGDLYSTTVAAYEAAHPLQVQFPTAGKPHAQRNIHKGELTDVVDRIFTGMYANMLNFDRTFKVANYRILSGLTD